MGTYLDRARQMLADRTTRRTTPEPVPSTHRPKRTPPVPLPTASPGPVAEAILRRVVERLNRSFPAGKVMRPADWERLRPCEENINRALVAGGAELPIEPLLHAASQYEAEALKLFEQLRTR